MVLKVHPDGVKPHEAGEFEHGGVGEMQGGGEDGFATAKLGFDDAITHGRGGDVGALGVFVGSCLCAAVL